MSQDWQQAADILLQGGLIGMPTETVYGLAACVDHPEALKNIFLIKQRPFFDPLIVHVKDAEQAKSCVKHWSLAAEILTKYFWPGPLTLVLPKADKIPDLITAGLETVGLRCPKHSLALQVLETVKVPLAAPSANKFKKTSPTCYQHVKDEFPDLFVLDGGPCQIGIESTVLWLQMQNDSHVVQLKILRKGAVTSYQIATCLEDQGLIVEWVASNDFDPHLAPGQMQHHYMPNKPLVIAEPSLPWSELKTAIKNATYTEMVLPSHSALAARELYAKLRLCAQTPNDIILLRWDLNNSSSEWEAINERLTKAATLILPKKD